MKAWYILKQEYDLNNNSYFQWLQLINSFLKNANLPLSKVAVMHEDLRGHLLMKGSRILILEKLTSKELYQILISSSTNKITSVTYIETIFNANNLDWTKIFILPPRVTTYNINRILKLSGVTFIRGRRLF